MPNYVTSPPTDLHWLTIADAARQIRSTIGRATHFGLCPLFFPQLLGVNQGIIDYGVVSAALRLRYGRWWPLL